MKKLGLLLTATLMSLPALGYDPKEVAVTGHELPQELQNVGVDEHLGSRLDLGLEFTDDKGQQVPLSAFFSSGRPVLMAMVYYECPSLCNYHLNGLTDTMKTLNWTPGRDFDVVAVSMNHRETPDLAAAKKATYLKAYGRPESANGWHFLVGTEKNVAALAKHLGFRFHWLEDKQQYAHAAVSYVLTPDGKISRYLHGIQPDPQTLRLSLLEASDGKIGSILEQVLMFCFQFDPQKNKYTLYAWNLMRIGGILMVLMLAVLLVPVWWREHARNRTRT
ncbi:MAG: SCO family protein [Bdellovibrionales bacterium]